MRHFLANIMAYAVAALLFLSAASFAWVRSAQVAITREAIVAARFIPGDTTFQWRELGASSYRRNCANCHLADGSGWDEYPGLRRTGDMLRSDDGREHLIDLHIYGLATPRWGAPMPPMGHITDVELAAVINYIATTFGGAGADELLGPDDIGARRGQRLAPGEVGFARPPAFRQR